MEGQSYTATFIPRNLKPTAIELIIRFRYNDPEG